MIGEILKKKREALGLDLKEIGASLRIRNEYLQALEEENFEKLPPEVYIRGYIREYADLLGIDPEPLISAYAKQQSTPHGEIQPEPSPQKKSNLFPLILFILSGAVIVSAIFMLFVRTKEAPVGGNAIVHISPPVQTQPEQKSAEISDLPSDRKNEEDKPSGVTPKQYVLQVSATDVTWLRIELDDGKSEEVLLKPGESKDWTSKEGFGLKIGNAGGVRLIVNGEDMGTPGNKGEVVKLRFPKGESPENAVDR
ncbi:MAG TPA: RodZ domain-containing protein [Thermodesulfovibrionales bacterium]|nr:RodZ domain-containing protein [Thermodesulfovibrionales bacterium]